MLVDFGCYRAVNGGLFMAKFDAVLFDFDGTVADTGEGVFYGVRHAIDVYGLKQPSDTDIRKFIGPPMVTSFKYFYPELPDEKIQELIKCFREKYAEVGLDMYRLYDGLEELLKKLSKNGIKAAVASSKPQDFLEKIIKSSRMDKYFDCIVGASRNFADSDKATIVSAAMEQTGVTDKSRILMVGDRKFDIVGAHKVGIACAAVLFGYGSREEFEEYHADYIVENFKEVEDLVMD